MGNKVKLDISYALTPKHIVELVEPNRGVTVISPVGEIEKLLSQLSQQASTFGFTQSLASTTTGVVQNFQAFSDFAPGSVWKELGERISTSLCNGFEQLGHSKLFRTSLNLDDLTLQYYPPSKPKDDYALSPHRDQSGFINLVVVLLVYGPSTFFICKDREGTKPIEPLEIRANPGDLMVMRAGEFGDNLSRPCHFVGRVNDPKGRLTLALRQITDDRTRVQKLECFFGRKFGPGAKVPH